MLFIYVDPEHEKSFTIAKKSIGVVVVVRYSYARACEQIAGRITSIVRKWSTLPKCQVTVKNIWKPATENMSVGVCARRSAIKGSTSVIFQGAYLFLRRGLAKPLSL